MIIENPTRAFDATTWAITRRAILVAVDNATWRAVYAVVASTNNNFGDAIRDAVNADPKLR